MFSWKNKKNINTFQLKKAHYLELCKSYHIFCLFSLWAGKTPHFTSRPVLKQTQFPNFQSSFSLRYTLKSTAVSVFHLVLLESFSVRMFSEFPEFNEANLSFVFATIFFPEDTCLWAICNMKSDWFLRACVFCCDWLTFDTKSCTFHSDRIFIYHSCLIFSCPEV